MTFARDLLSSSSPNSTTIDSFDKASSTSVPIAATRSSIFPTGLMMSDSPSVTPSNVPSGFPTPTPSVTPSTAPTLTEESIATITLLQGFVVSNGRIFNESEQVFFQDVMIAYTQEIVNHPSKSKRINTTCTIKMQRLLLVLERRRRNRYLEEIIESTNVTNQVEYVMQWSSRYMDVTNYPSKFNNIIDTNPDGLDLRLQERGLSVLSSSSLRTVVTTDAPSAIPTLTYSPSRIKPYRIPTTSPRIPSTTVPSILSINSKPDLSQAKPDPPFLEGNNNSKILSIVLASLISLLLIAFLGACIFVLLRRRKAKKMAFHTSAVSDQLPNEISSQVPPTHPTDKTYLDSLSTNLVEFINYDIDDVVSPEKSHVTSQSLLSPAISMGEETIDEADCTHHLADEFDKYKDQNLEKVRADVQDLVIGSDSMMNQAMVLAFMGYEDAVTETLEVGKDGKIDSTEIETSALCEVHDFLKRNEDADVEDRKTFLQETTNKMVSFVRHGIVEPDDATRTIHESAAMLGLGLATEMPENTVIVTGLRKTVTTNHLETTFREFGDIDEAAVASDARGFGLVRFLSPHSAIRAMNTFRESEIVVQDVAVTVKVLKADAPIEEG